MVDTFFLFETMYVQCQNWFYRLFFTVYDFFFFNSWIEIEPEWLLLSQIVLQTQAAKS